MIRSASSGLNTQHRNRAAVRDILQPVKIRRFHRLFHQLKADPPLLHLIQDPDRLLRRPGLIGINADADIRSDRTADSEKSLHIQRRIDADLDLDGVIAAPYRVHGVLRHLFRRVHTDRNVRDNRPAGASQQLVYRDVIQLAVQIVQCHIHSRLGRGIVHDRLLHLLNHILEFIHIPSDEFACDMILNGSDNRSGRIPGDDAGRRRLAEALFSRIRVNFHDYIPDAVHRPERRLERHPQRNCNLSEPDCCNFHLSSSSLSSARLSAASVSCCGSGAASGTVSPWRAGCYLDFTLP